METVSKYSLNPLATCFVPSSMKNKSIASGVFPVLGYETSAIDLLVTKNGLLPIVGKQKTVTEHFGVMKGGQKVLSKSVKEKTINEEFVVPTIEVKGMLSDIAKKEVSTAGQLTTKVHLSISEGTGKIPNKLDGKKISGRRSKKRIGSKDTSLAEFDNAQPKQIFGEIFKFLKRGTKVTKSLSMIWPFAVSIFVMDLFYLMSFNTISLDLILCANVYSVFKSHRNTITYPKASKKAKITKSNPKSDECHCPPTFGWIVPGFLGNPLKPSKTCCKDYVHITYVDGNSLQPPKSERFMSEDELSSANYETKTLEQCSLELKAVIKDVCDSLSFSDDQGNEESSKTKVSQTRKRPVWEFETGNEVGMKRLTPEVIDDGFHPLLDEISSVDTDDTDIASIQKMLGEAFSYHKVSSEKEILPSQSVCNLPCSVWCDTVPPSAKDAYKRFIKKLDSESTVHRHVTEAKRTVIKKPLYKRCFSADDSPKSSVYCKTPLLSGSDFESRERLMLLRTDPIAFIKQSSTTASKDNYRKSRSNVSAVSEQVATKDFSNDYEKWSFYDGDDSLWQPLPDCIPLGDSAQKHSHKKVRDMRRQKSVC